MKLTKVHRMNIKVIRISSNQNRGKCKKCIIEWIIMPFKRFSRSRRQPKWIDKQILEDSQKRPAYPAKIVKVSIYLSISTGLWISTNVPLNVWEERFIFVNILSIYKYTINKKFLAFINCIKQGVLHVFSFISAHIRAIGRWEFGSRDQRFRSIHQSCIYARIS